MAHDREMTADYAALSFLAGVLAAAADKHLGDDEFIMRTRRQAWDLTWEKLAAWQAEALKRGVPAEDLKVDHLLDRMPSLLPHLMRLQQLCDEKRARWPRD